MALTIKEIAKLSGVSRGTVDRVIHGRPGVSPEIRERIQQILDEKNYEPNAAAVALRRTDRRLTVGVVIPDLSNEFYIDVYEGIRAAARHCGGFGVCVEEYKMQDSTGEELIRGIDFLMQKKVDALAFQGIDEEPVRQRLAQLPRDFPLVTFNNDLPGIDRLCFVGQESVAAGEVAGQMMRLFLRRQGPVAIFTGRASLSHQMERVRGFRSIIEGCSNVSSICGPFETCENEQIAFRQTEQLLRTCPDLAGIYAAGGGQKSIASALAQSGREQDVVMIGHDLLPRTVEFLASGVVDCTIAQEPYAQGYFPVEILSEYLLYHRTPAVDRLLTAVDIRIRGNARFNGIGGRAEYNL